MSLISAEHLRTLRNDVPVHAVLAHLRVPTKNRGQSIYFRCPECGRFTARINPQENLLRCFRCDKDFNPIDIVQEECRCSFRQVVRHLEFFLPSCR